MNPTLTRRVLVAAGIDVAMVLVFAMVGRRSHVEGLNVTGVLSTAWPFLAGLALGWLPARGRRAPTALRTGAVVWALTLVAGMALRRLVGAGTAPSFVLVAALVLAGLLLGWRALWTLGHRR